MKAKSSEETLVAVDNILRHIANVRENCFILGRKLILQGNADLGVALVGNGLVHDNSKLRGVEFSYLYPGIAKTKLQLAIQHHNQTNAHHPEYWGGIENMPDIYLCEMVCDWKARSEEFGTSIYDWALDEAPKRFSYKKNSDICKKILYYLSLLCDKPFTQSD